MPKLLHLVMPLLIVSLLSACGGGGGGGSSATGRETSPGEEPGSTDETDPPDTPQTSSRAWSTGLPINPITHAASNPSVRVTASGDLYVLWLEAENDQHRLMGGHASLTNDNFTFTLQPLSAATAKVHRDLGFQRSKSAPENYTPSPQLALGQDGVAHAVWLQKEGTGLTVWGARYVPQNQAWTDPIEITPPITMDDTLQLEESPDGDHLLFIERTSPDGTALSVSQFYRNSNSWSDAKPVHPNKKPGSRVAVVFDGSVARSYLVAQGATNHDVLVEHVINLADTSVSSPETLATHDEIASLTAVLFQNEPHVFFVGDTGTGDLDVLGIKAGEAGNVLLSGIEAEEDDAGHLQAAVLDDHIHLAWKQEYSGSASTWLFDDLLATAYDGQTFSDPKQLFDSGAAHPMLINGKDNYLYLIWYSSHTNYRVLNPQGEWESWSRPFCYDANDSLSCYNSGQEHQLSVNGDFGAAVWITTLDGVDRLFLSVSLSPASAE